MTQSMYLVYKANPQLGSDLVNGVTHAIVNAATLAKAKTNAALAANALFAVSEGQSEANPQGTDLFSPTYFDSGVAISSSGGVPESGNGSANGDAYVFPERDTAEYVDHSAYSPVS